MDNQNDNIKKCTFCGMDVPAVAGRCSYCGSLLGGKADHNVFTNPKDEGAPVWEKEASSKENDKEALGYKYDTTQPVDKTAFEVKPALNTDSGYRQGYKMPPDGSSSREPLSNGLKVFLTILFTVIPGIGQLAGIITAIVFMNADDDADRKSFGVALLVASIILFVLSCIGCFVLALVFSINQSSIF